MNARKKSQRAWAAGLFSAGLVTLMVFYGLLVWGDLEASLFSSSSAGSDPAESLDCPLILTGQESGEVLTSYTNTLERPINATVRMTISEGSVILVRQEIASVELAPGESHTFSWPIQPSDAAWDRFVFARVYNYPVYPIPNRSSACSTLVLNIPWPSGNAVAASILIFSAGLMVGGLWLWARAHQPLKGAALSLFSGMVFIMALAAIGTITAMQGKWVVSGLILVANLLATMVVLAYKLNTD